MSLWTGIGMRSSGYWKTGCMSVTSIIIFQGPYPFLGGRFRAWAVVGTFGDNFDSAARRAAGPLGLDEARLATLRGLGVCLNYNGYGARIEDLHFAPDALFRRLRPYRDIPSNSSPRTTPSRPSATAMPRTWRGRGRCNRKSWGTATRSIYCPPSPGRSGRANRLAHASVQRAHAVLTRLPEGGFVVSVRAPAAVGTGADALCRRFPTGGGRKAAAGIDHLPDADYDAFVREFLAAFQDLEQSYP